MFHETSNWIIKTRQALKSDKVDRHDNRRFGDGEIVDVNEDRTTDRESRCGRRWLPHGEIRVTANSRRCITRALAASIRSTIHVDDGRSAMDASDFGHPRNGKRWKRRFPRGSERGTLPGACSPYPLTKDTKSGTALLSSRYLAFAGPSTSGWNRCPATSFASNDKQSRHDIVFGRPTLRISSPTQLTDLTPLKIRGRAQLSRCS